MSTADSPMRASITVRISGVHGSAPKMPIRRLDWAGSSPWRTNSSAMASM